MSIYIYIYTSAGVAVPMVTRGEATGFSEGRVGLVSGQCKNMYIDTGVNKSMKYVHTYMNTRIYTYIYIYMSIYTHIYTLPG